MQLNNVNMNDGQLASGSESRPELATAMNYYYVGAAEQLAGHVKPGRGDAEGYKRSKSNCEYVSTPAACHTCHYGCIVV